MMIKFLDLLLLEYSFDLSNTYDYQYIGGTNTKSYKFKTAKDTDYYVDFVPNTKNKGQYERVYHPIKDMPGTLTNEGDAYKINATVMKVTLDFLKRNKDWDVLHIQPIDRRRKKIVDAFIDKNLPSAYEKDESDGVILIYKKNNKS